MVVFIGFICSGLVYFVKDPKRGAKEAAVLEMRRNLGVVPSSLSESDRRATTTATAVYGENLHSHIALENCGMEYQASTAEPGVSAMPNGLITVTAEPVTQNDGNEVAVTKRTCVSLKSTTKLMKIPSVVLTILAAAPGALPFGFCATFFNDYLQEQRGMTKQVRKNRYLYTPLLFI